jgi:hypothetical protein
MNETNLFKAVVIQIMREQEEVLSVMEESPRLYFALPHHRVGQSSHWVTANIIIACIN